ncbi:MAG: hypothetical protein FJ096_10385 [Deltaproteobacteria bacterium]|nr:hypothetical protein [Deltaproteobacteria bacterium]
MTRPALVRSFAVMALFVACGGRSAIRPDLSGDADDETEAATTNGVTTGGGVLAGAGGALVAVVGAGGMEVTVTGSGTASVAIAGSGVGGTTTTATAGVGGMSATSTTSGAGGMSTSVAASTVAASSVAASTVAASSVAASTVAASSVAASTVAASSVAASSSTGGVVNCATCAFTKCPAVVKCFQSQTCLAGISCTVQSCLSGGTPDFLCALKCFNNDFGAANEAISALSCVVTQCGSDCQSLFGG